MLETNEIVSGALEEDVISARNAIAKLIEKGLDLSDVPVNQLESILFSDNPNEALRGVAVNIPEEKKRELLKMEAEKIVDSGIPVDSFSEELDDDDPEKNKWNKTYEVANWDNNALQSAFDKLANIFDLEACPYNNDEKTDLVIRLIAKVADRIDEERHDIKHQGEGLQFIRDYDNIEYLLENFVDMALETFPSLGLIKEGIVEDCYRIIRE